MNTSWAERIRRVMADPSHLALALIIGALVGSTIVAFLAFTDWMHTVLFSAAMPVWMRPLMPGAAALIAGYLLLRVFPEARGSGIPQTKAALFAGGGHIGLRTAIGKFLCCSLSLGGGIALGREGPSVQIGAGVASFLARKVGVGKREVQALVPVGAAAALAAAFNTPMAAVLFTLEELLGDMNARVLGSVVIGAATSWMVLHLFLGDAPLFHVPAYSLAHPTEFFFYALLGIAGGLVSVVFTSLLLWLRLEYRKLPQWSLALQPATGGLAAGILALYSAEVLGAGYAAVELALHGELSTTAMFLLLLLKLVATVFCYSSGNAGGIFGPSLFLGAMLGGGFGSLLHSWLPETTGPAGAYALVGMGTTFAGVIRSPITSVVMIFELTRDYNIIVPLMISNMAAYATARAFYHTPIYEALALQDGVHLPQAKGHVEVADLSVGNAMRSPARLLSPDMTVAEARARVPDGDVLVGGEEKLLGVIRAEAIEKAFLEDSGSITLYEMMRRIEYRRLPHVHPDHPPELALRRLAQFEMTLLPVVDRRDVTIVLGEVSLKDLLAAYRNASGNDEV
ncbi:MAG: chloride channel protein [Bryobacteraceae bacterium]